MYFGSDYSTSAVNQKAALEDGYRGEAESEKAANFDKTVGTRFSASDVEDFKSQFPGSIQTSDLLEQFQDAISESSGVVCHSMVNVCVLYVSVFDTADARADALGLAGQLPVLEST